MRDAVQDLHLPLRTDLAGETFAAAFMGKKAAQTVKDLPQINRFIIDLDHT